MRVLVVEDDAKIREGLVAGLRAHDLSTELARDGVEALELVTETGVFDAIVLDVMMPGRDGFDVCRKLRERGVTTPVLMLTARASVEDRIKGLDTGADDYLAKPFDLQELLARLRAITRRPQVDSAAVLRAADLVLDTAARVAKRGGRMLPLTARELALLEYMMREKGRVLSKSMILDRVWDLGHDGGSNLVAVYIQYLRRKVDGSSAMKLIHTVRGVGYVLREDA